MALFLVQHGQCLSKEQDPEQSLSNKGTATVERIASVAGDYDVQVSTIEHSVKKRARQTAAIFDAVLHPDAGIIEKIGLKPMDDVVPVAARVRARDNVMLVGHLPFMERLAAYLITGTTDIRVFKFQNSGIVALDQEAEDGSWFIKWALMPEIK